MSDKFIRRSSATAARALGDEMIVLAVADSTLFSLNEAARLLWEAADGRRPLREIVNEVIVPQFEVDAETAYCDALELVEQLAGHGILELADQPLEQADA
ncbi:MAG TPA: PqqD family protein [Candidatus Acidoferrales bacterium]|nr:PqqD family protein [Candidatus Acidoferrales bacterium]